MSRKRKEEPKRKIPPGGYDVYAIANALPVKLGHVQVREDDEKGYGALAVAGYLSREKGHYVEIGKPGKMRDFMHPDATAEVLAVLPVLPVRVGGYRVAPNKVGGLGRFKQRYALLLTPDATTPDDIFDSVEGSGPG